MMELIIGAIIVAVVKFVLPPIIAYILIGVCIAIVAIYIISGIIDWRNTEFTEVLGAIIVLILLLGLWALV